MVGLLNRPFRPMDSTIRNTHAYISTSSHIMKVNRTTLLLLEFPIITPAEMVKRVEVLNHFSLHIISYCLWCSTVAFVFHLLLWFCSFFSQSEAKTLTFCIQMMVFLSCSHIHTLLFAISLTCPFFLTCFSSYSPSLSPSFCLASATVIFRILMVYFGCGLNTFFGVFIYFYCFTGVGRFFCFSFRARISHIIYFHRTHLVSLLICRAERPARINSGWCSIFYCYCYYILPRRWACMCIWRLSSLFICLIICCAENGICSRFTYAITHTCVYTVCVVRLVRYRQNTISDINDLNTYTYP